MAKVQQWYLLKPILILIEKVRIYKWDKEKLCMKLNPIF